MIVDAALDAALRNTIMQGNLQQNHESLALARLLVSAASDRGARLHHCFFSTSGAMANENALKLVFQKKTPADRVLAFEGCFMGRTLALSQVTDRPAYRAGLPSMMAVDYVRFSDPNSPQESRKLAIEQIRGHLSRYPGKHAALVFELVQGEGGFFPGDREFFVPLMREARENGLSVIVDEVQTF